LFKLYFQQLSVIENVTETVILALLTLAPGAAQQQIAWFILLIDCTAKEIKQVQPPNPYFHLVADSM
jgi:hypothetical protein